MNGTSSDRRHTMDELVLAQMKVKMFQMLLQWYYSMGG